MWAVDPSLAGIGTLADKLEPREPVLKTSFEPSLVPTQTHHSVTAASPGSQLNVTGELETAPPGTGEVIAGPPLLVAVNVSSTNNHLSVEVARYHRRA